MTVMDTLALMTTEQLLAMPEDGMDRELVRGQLREKPMTRRNRRHSRSGSRFAYFLELWLDTQPPPRGEVLVGEAGIWLTRDPDTTVGVDVCFISAETARKTPDDARLIEGAPVLVIEILSPSDTNEAIWEKIAGYLNGGVKLVWIADPAFRTITVYRGDAEPELFNASQEVSGDPCMPGLRIPVAEAFGRSR